MYYDKKIIEAMKRLKKDKEKFNLTPEDIVNAAKGYLGNNQRIPTDQEISKFLKSLTPKGGILKIKSTRPTEHPDIEVVKWDRRRSRGKKLTEEEKRDLEKEAALQYCYTCYQLIKEGRHTLKQKGVWFEVQGWDVTGATVEGYILQVNKILALLNKPKTGTINE